MTIGDGSLTLRQSPGPRRRSSATGRWEATRNRTNARACKRFDRALREAVRVNACIVSRPNNDVTMAAPMSDSAWTTRLAKRIGCAAYLRRKMPGWSKKL
jgi:hypothetical protein